MLRFWLAFSGISKPDSPHNIQEAMVARGRRNCITSVKDLRAESFQTYSNASEEEILEGEEDDEDGEGSQTKGVILTTDGETKSTTTQLKISPTIVLHYSPFKSAWDWLILLLVLYVAVVVPYMAAFRSSEQFPSQTTPLNASNYSDYQTMPLNASNFTDFQTTPQTPPQNTTTFSDFLIRTLLSDKFVICDMVVDFLFMVDILVNFRTTYLYNGELIVKPGKIAVNYLRGWFLIDFVSAVPFDLIITIAKQTDTVTATALMKTARLLRLVRVARKMDQYSEYGASFLLLLMAFFTLIAHWLACIFYTIAENERLSLRHPIGWLDWLANKTGSPYLVNDTSSGPNVQSKYITSLYFTFTILTSVGFGNISPVTDNEKIFSIFAMLLGSLMSAAIFGNVASIMLRMYQGSEEYHEKSSSIKEFIEFHHIPKNLASRLMESNQQSYWETNGIDMTKEFDLHMRVYSSFKQVLKSFPEGLQADICLHLNNTLLTKCPAFQNASPGCLRMLSVKFKSVHVPPGDTLIHQSDVLAEAFFVSRGTIEITKDGVVVAILTKNDIFGEEMSKIIQKTLCKGSSLSYRSKYLVRALSYCDLHKILISDLIVTLRYYPEFAVDFFQRFQMTFNLCSKFDHEISRNSSDVNLSTNGLKDENLEPFEISPSIQHLFKVVSRVSTQGGEADEDDVEGDGKDSSGAEEQDGTNRRTSILSSPEDLGNPVIVVDMQDSMSASLMWDNTDLEDGGGVLFQRHQPQTALDNDDEDATLIGSPTSTISGYNYFNVEETRTPFDLDPSERPLATTPTIGSMAGSYHEQHRMAHIESRLGDINNRLLKLDRDMSLAVDAIMEYLVPEVYNEGGVRMIDWQ